MKKNLISVSAMEEKGFDVTFSGEQVLMHPRGASITSAKVIGTRSGKLYKFNFQSAGVLVSSTSDSTHNSTSNSRDLCELWHRRMALMHQGALRVLREITTGVPDFSVEHYEVYKGCALGNYVAKATNIVDFEPTSYEDAASQEILREAMVQEYASVIKNNVWEVVPRPEGKSVVISKWLYKIKRVADGSIEKFKATFVARGFSQIEGVDYDETFAPVAQYISIWFLISIAAKMGW
eukprot:PITA_05584